MPPRSSRETVPVEAFAYAVFLSAPSLHKTRTYSLDSADRTALPPRAQALVNCLALSGLVAFHHRSALGDPRAPAAGQTAHILESEAFEVQRRTGARVIVRSSAVGDNDAAGSAKLVRAC